MVTIERAACDPGAARGHGGPRRDLAEDEPGADDASGKGGAGAERALCAEWRSGDAAAGWAWFTPPSAPPPPPGRRAAAWTRSSRSAWRFWEPRPATCKWPDRARRRPDAASARST